MARQFSDDEIEDNDPYYPGGDLPDIDGPDRDSAVPDYDDPVYGN
jgi:hypothetical protein